jgi:hypothetical protein
MTTYSGSCACGAVEFDVTGEAVAEAYCHCRICASWSGAPVSPMVVVPAGSIRVTRGAENLGTFNKTPSANRKFCTKCGGHVLCEMPGDGLEEFYPDTVPDYPFEPSAHIFYGSRSLAMPDGLPKFKDMPAEFGGSGETVPE